MKKIVVILVLVLSPFAMGLFAQCDSNDLKGVGIAFDYSWKLVPTICTDAESDPPMPFDTSEWRRIYFVHGLGGDFQNRHQWTRPADACRKGLASNFPARKCRTECPIQGNLDTSLSMRLFDLESAINLSVYFDSVHGDNLITPSRSIMITHGIGGMHVRELMHKNLITKGYLSKDFGGLVTIATPLQGAKILNPENRQMLLDFGANGYTNLLKGPIDAKNRGISSTLEAEVKTIMENAMRPIMEKHLEADPYRNKYMFFNDYYKNVASDYFVGSSRIDTLNRDTTYAQYRNFPKIAFYAVEPTTNTLWRTLNWMAMDPDLYGCFDANSDFEYHDQTIRIMINSYQAMKEYHRAEYDRMNKQSEIPIIGIIYYWANSDKINKEYSSSVEWGKGLDWINSANEQWKTIMGNTLILSNGGATRRLRENDGVVLAESAMNLPGASRLPIRIYPNEDSPVDFEKGSSHMQVRNDAGLKEHLRKLLDGKYDPWFQTPKIKE